MKVKSESEVAQLCPIVATPWTAAYQAPPSKGFSRQKYWSGVPLPSPIRKLARGQILMSGSESFQKHGLFSVIFCLLSLLCRLGLFLCS